MLASSGGSETIQKDFLLSFQLQSCPDSPKPLAIKDSRTSVGGGSVPMQAKLSKARA